MSMAWEPDRSSNSFFSPPAHLSAVTYMTEVSLIVTLNNQFTHCVVTLLFGFFCGCRGFCHKTESDLFLFLSMAFSTYIYIYIYIYNILQMNKYCQNKYRTPWGHRGRIRPQHPLACRKRRLNGAACLPWAATRVA